MALATRGLLQFGAPILPSGMFYPRGLSQVWLMAGSVALFGESPWSLRLSSAVAGSLTPLLAFYLGKRFLNPTFNLAFVSLVALMPILIELSQNARMYILWQTGLFVFGIMLFRWELRRSYLSLAGAFLAFLFALQFHLLAVFSLPLFLFPGLVSGNRRQLGEGAAACAAGLGLFWLYNHWIGAQYPDAASSPQLLESKTSGAVAIGGSIEFWLIAAGLAAFLLGSSTIFFVLRKGLRGAENYGAVLLVNLALLACISLNFHLGLILLLAGMILLWRQGCIGLPQSLLVVTPFLLIGATQFWYLSSFGDEPLRRVLGALIGQPNIRPMLRFATGVGVLGVAAYTLVMLFALTRVARKIRIPDHFLFGLMAIWAPLLTIGFFGTYIALRYTLVALPYFLLCLTAGVAFLSSRAAVMRRLADSSRAQAGIAAALVVLAVSPMGLLDTVNAGYEKHVDHAGAAQYILAQDLPGDAVLIAEDVVEQTFYLGRVDYWLTESGNAERYSIVQGGEILDSYTGTKVLHNGRQLAEILDENKGKTLYIIGSGTTLFRGEGIEEVLLSDRLQRVYTGRDKRTVVWRLAEG